MALILEVLSRPATKVPLAWFGLLAVPLLFYGGVPRSYPGSFYQAMINAWESLLHVSIYLVTFVTLMGATFLVFTAAPNTTEGTPLKPKTNFQLAWALVKTTPGVSLGIILLFLQLASFASYQQVVSPGWLCNPFLILTGYRVYWPNELEAATKGICRDYKLGEKDRDPLCLSEESWDTLSSGALSSHVSEDVETVLQGMEYISNQSGGLVVSIMGRDVNEHIDTVRINIESLQAFFPTLSVVVFENDSSDGSRDHFKNWAKDSTITYKVDLIACSETENKDCVFGKSHRYDAKEAEDFFMSSTIGEMHKFRQRVVDHITSSSEYNNYSHMLLLDLDLDVSISPLGIVHSLGSVQNSAIASSCRQPWPGGLGTLAPPYDFNAFESVDTIDTKWLKGLHKQFCAFMPPGDRWRFVCEAASPFKFLQIIQLDRANNYPYPVESAFNGATLYPLQLIRETKPQYDAGDDGQRCEHISFNRGLKKHMFVNPKWDMHMSPTLPGGPKGEQALKFFRRFGTLPNVAIPMFLFNFVPLSILVLSVMTLGVHYLSMARAKSGSSGNNSQRSSKRDA